MDKTDKTFFGGLLIFLVGCFILTALLGNLLGSWECTAKTRDMNLNSKFDMVAGCMIEVEEDKWLPFENYRYVESEK